MMTDFFQIISVIVLSFIGVYVVARIWSIAWHRTKHEYNQKLYKDEWRANQPNQEEDANGNQNSP